MTHTNYESWFAVGSVHHSRAVTEIDRSKAIKAIESLMIEHDIIKIDACIDPYRFPQNLIDLRNENRR
jgi:hypothetical protein